MTLLVPEEVGSFHMRENRVIISDCRKDSDFKGSTGFEVLVKKLKDGRQMCKDFEDFLRQRAKIEDTYSKDLHKLAQTQGGNTETGSLRVSWDSMRAHLDKVSQEHSELSKVIAEAATRMAEFKEAQKKDFKKEEANVKGCITRKIDQFKKTQDSKKAFEKASSDAEQIKMQVRSASGSGQTSRGPADMSKGALKGALYNKQVKTEEESDKLNHAYKDNLTKLEQLRIQWETIMISACNMFERLEEQRIVFLRNEMWVHLNAQSQACVRTDDNNEEVRMSLDKCDPDVDIVKFINEKRTGSERPAKIQYDANNRQMVSHQHGHGPKSATPQAQRPRFVQQAMPQSGHPMRRMPFPGQKR
ncbi:Proline-serine-threonine phosphatase-interacting protein 1 [Lamellibrachia satsuma]|nr:Proline-serine-threonine phosphatase-interacting protein 1 [Lamellibrachia satsuma]